MPAASRLLASVRPSGTVEAMRKQLARELVAEIRDADRRLKILTAQIAEAVATARQPAAAGPRHRPGGGRAPARATRRASRFPTAAAFASYAGVAPIEVASETAPAIACREVVTGN